MSTGEQLKKFTLIELHIMLEHLRLGIDHLKGLLTATQFKELLKWNALDLAQKDSILSDRAEKWGNAALALNTIITSTFGAWMGLSGCMGMSLGSPLRLFMVTSLAFLLSGVVGYTSFKSTRQKENQAINRQKLYNLELKILKTINLKQEEGIETLTHYLNAKLYELEQTLEEPFPPDTVLQPYSFRAKQDVLNWLNRLQQLVHSQLRALAHFHLYDLYTLELTKTFSQIKKIISKETSVIEKLSLDLKRAKKHAYLKQSQTLSFMKVLTDPILTNPTMQKQPSFWLKNNRQDILLGLAPTLLGGFASMFVFLGGIPNLAREFKLYQLEAFFIHPYSRAIELMMAVGLTFYFGFSHVYSSYKGIRRHKILEKTQMEITNQETLLLEKVTQFQTLSKLKARLYKILLISTFIDRTSRHASADANKEEPISVI